MPYIDPKHRPALDKHIDALADQVTAITLERSGDNTAYAGLLNYCCTRLAMAIIKRQFKGLRYWLVAMTTGVFHNVADEFYRRMAAPYEDKQIKANGDVDLYAEFLKQINPPPPEGRAAMPRANPCKQCGVDQHLHRECDGTQHRVFCTCCDRKGPYAADLGAAITAWNAENNKG